MSECILCFRLVQRGDFFFFSVDVLAVRCLGSSISRSRVLNEHRSEQRQAAPKSVGELAGWKPSEWIDLYCEPPFKG